MLNRINSRHSEASDHNGSPTRQFGFHRHQAVPRERTTPLHETFVPVGRHETIEDGQPLSPPPQPPRIPAPLPRESFEGPAEDVGGRDRRLSHRYEVGNTRSVLSWWEPIEFQVVADPDHDPVELPAGTDSTVFSAVMARGMAFRNSQGTRAAVALVPENMTPRYSNGVVVDISQTGMAILCETPPRTDLKIWLRLDAPNPTDWVEVVIKGIKPASQGRHLVRLAFLQSCPYDFFRTVLCGKVEP